MVRRPARRHSRPPPSCRHPHLHLYLRLHRHVGHSFLPLCMQVEVLEEDDAMDDSNWGV